MSYSAPVQNEFSLSAQEERVLKKLQKECFWLGVVPTTLFTVTGVGLATHWGMISQFPRWLYIFKVTPILASANYVAIKAYARTAQQRFDKLVVANRADATRIRQAGAVPVVKAPVVTERVVKPRTLDDAVPGQILFHSDAYTLPALSFFSTFGNEATTNTNVVSETVASDAKSAQLKRTTTYEELRERNRLRFVLATALAAQAVPTTIGHGNDMPKWMETKDSDRIGLRQPSTIQN